MIKKVIEHCCLIIYLENTFNYLRCSSSKIHLQLTRQDIYIVIVSVFILRYLYRGNL